VLGELSKLNFDATEYIKKTVATFADLDKFDTDKVEATHHLFGMCNVLRDDAVEVGTSKEDLLKCAPNSDDDYVIVPEVLDG